MVVFDSRSVRTHAVSDDLCGCTGRTAIPPDPRFEVKELGEIDMVSRARATLDLVTHDDARPAFPAVHLEGHTVLSYGELAGLRVWRASQDAVRDWRPSPFTGPVDVFGPPPIMALPATAVQLAGAPRELIADKR